MPFEPHGWKNEEEKVCTTGGASRFRRGSSMTAPRSSAPYDGSAPSAGVAARAARVRAGALSHALPQVVAVATASFGWNTKSIFSTLQIYLQ